MDENNSLVPQQPSKLAQFTEQNASMMQQLATAQIQSRYMVATHFPRNVEQVRQNMLLECQRPEFCLPDPSKHGSSLAIYAVPRGKVQDANGQWVPNIIRGFSIRFAEMAARAWKNLSIDVVPIGEDKSQRMFQVTATDFEANITASQIVIVPKSVERQNNKDNLPVLSQRTNSYGKTVFTLEATEDEISMNAQRLISKARRNLILQCIPGWILEECVQCVKDTAAKKDAEAPDVARRRIFDAYASVGVNAEQLTGFIGHANELTPAEMDELRGFFSALREGATTWKEIVDSRQDAGEAGNATEKQIDELLEKLEYTVPRARNIKAKHVGRADVLLKLLQDELAKKQNTGARKEESANPSSSAPAAENRTGTEAQAATRNTSAAAHTQTEAQTTTSTENQDSEPEPQPQQTTQAKPSPAGPKKVPPPVNTKGW